MLPMMVTGVSIGSIFNIIMPNIVLSFVFLALNIFLLYGLTGKLRGVLK